MSDVNQAVKAGWSKQEIAAHVARAIPAGSYVNLGIGIPTLVADQPLESDVVLHSEQGLLGVGPAPRPGEENPDLINAAKAPVTMVKGGAFMSHADSFALIRGGHLDFAVMGAFEVAANGDLANWSMGADIAPGVGGAMDLAVGAKEVWVAMTYRTRDGSAKCVRRCSLPLTGHGVVTRVFTDVANFEVLAEEEKFLVTSMAPGWSLDELRAVSSANVVM